MRVLACVNPYKDKDYKVYNQIREYPIVVHFSLFLIRS